MSGLGKIIKIVPCANCGANVEIRHKKRLEAKYICCSKKCMNEFTKKNNPNYISCVVCGNVFYCKPSARVLNGNCCSVECSAKHRETMFLAENNPNYGNIGSLNPIWKSDERISPYGYRLLRATNHPFVNSDGFVFEHRLVAEKYLLNDKNSIIINRQQYLSKDFVVHHIDFDRLNNEINNLCVMPKNIHVQFHNSLRHINRDVETGKIISVDPLYKVYDPEMAMHLLEQFIKQNNIEELISRIEN